MLWTVVLDFRKNIQKKAPFILKTTGPINGRGQKLVTNICKRPASQALSHL